MLDDYLQNHLEREVTRSIVDNSNSKLACCVGRDGNGGYNFRTSDGRNISATIPTDITAWGSGDWVTLERSSNGWAVSGVGAFSGGPLPEAADYTTG